MNMNGLTQLQEMELDELNELFHILGVEPGGFNLETGEVPEEVTNRFKIIDLDGLNWALRKVGALAAKKAQIKALQDAELKRINEWAAKEYKGIDANVDFFNVMISHYAETRRAEDEKYKGEKTPYGGVKFTKQQPEWTYPEELATIEFLEQDEKLAEHVKTEKTIANKTQIKKALEIKRNVFVKNGEVVDMAQETEGVWVGMQYKESVVVVSQDDATEERPAGEYIEIVDMGTGEMCEDVQLVGLVVVAGGVKVVPGVKVVDRSDKITVEA